jgi:hypothetical protein
MTYVFRQPVKGTIGRLQFVCRMTLHVALCLYFIVGACVIEFHLATAVFSLGQVGSEIISVLCLAYVCMIIIALACVHDCVIEMRRQIRLVRSRH